MVHLLTLAALAAPAPQPTVAAEAVTVESGNDRGLGNVVAVQPWVTPLDYLTAEGFERALRQALEPARAAGWLRPDTVVVLPEYVGTWLVVVGEKPRVVRAPTSKKAMTRLVLRNLHRWRRAKRAAPAEDRATYGVFALKAPELARTYQEVLSRIAADHGVTVVGGSLLLPEPRVVDGELVAGPPGAPLQNVSALFGPDGSLATHLVRKIHLTEDEQPFLGEADPARMPVYRTAAGAVGVLICADAWYPRAWKLVGEAEVVAIPQYTAGAGTWDAPWGGYSGQEAPEDVDPDLVGTLSEGEAWAVYAVPGRALPHQTVVTAPLRGELWDLGTDGRIRWQSPQGGGEAARVDGPAVVNVWR